jgi:hypothetical protein
LRTSPWVHVDKIMVYGNGEVIDTILVPGGQLNGRDIDDDATFRRIYTFSRDTVLVAEALGTESMFPVITPQEDPPASIGDALSGIAAGMNLGGTFGGGDGIIAPTYVEKVTPYALTNPIWLDIDASGSWDPPGNLAGAAPAPEPASGQCSAGSSGTPQPRPMFHGRPGSAARAAASAREDIRNLFGDQH